MPGHSHYLWHKTDSTYEENKRLLRGSHCRAGGSLSKYELDMVFSFLHFSVSGRGTV